VSTPLAFWVWRRGSVTTGGAVVGVILAGVIYAGVYLAGLLVLLTALTLTLASSRLGHDKKNRLGIAEERGGRRGAANIIANCLIGAIGAAIEWLIFGWGSDLNAAFFVAGIAAGASDTVASEVGKAWSGQPRAFPNFRIVPAGTPGAISVIGTIAGMAAAAVIAVPAAVLWLIPANFLPAIVLACTAGAFVESALATYLEPRQRIGNHALNLINTAAAAALAVFLCSP
jgi:uncharacterized protein (TIGR00297 family)